MIAVLNSGDGRLLARVIHLAHRFGCTYTQIEGHQNDGRYAVRLHFSGPGEALARLSKHIDKLTLDDKENS